MKYSIVGICLASAFALAAPQADEVNKKELAKFQGSWAAVSVQNTDGQFASQEDLAATRLDVAGNKFTLSGRGYTISGSFSIDVSKSPKTIDVLLEDSAKTEVKLLGIYEIKDNIRRSCFALPGKTRPTQFMTSVEGHLMFEWKAR